MKFYRFRITLTSKGKFSLFLSRRLQPTESRSPNHLGFTCYPLNILVSNHNEDRQKIAIITGGTGGIGFATSKALASQGYNLILGYLSDSENAKKCLQELETDFNIEVRTISGDVCEEGTVNSYFSCLNEMNGKLTAIVHTAGLFKPNSFSKDPNTCFSTFEYYDYYQDIYPKCFIRLVETGMKFMEDGHGYIVCLSSPGCNINDHVRLGYMMPGTGKCVLEYLSRHYAKMLAKRGISCNCIVPGYIQTKPWKLRESILGPDVGCQRTPMGRWGQPEEIGDFISYLCSPKASFLTGATIPFDGGLSLGKQ
ncbi:3-oxoacyl-[acyl-carrier-protein] reductase FabG-like isoform X1 [Octopus sinensis]|uniref:3-oxoacyl-[acyl-carrier-protein] reductase FabG-like isoform X1 n=1 Tax=Octopus sinensis TaxID=2607531 RepID=A0A7E6EK57_9MOLL|nr:3-oxoacyl-[acyl-carrier-protein] reductase FabG-like isoform X1 [Octopus sinensis]